VIQSVSLSWIHYSRKLPKPRLAHVKKTRKKKIILWSVKHKVRKKFLTICISIVNSSSVTTHVLAVYKSEINNADLRTSIKLTHFSFKHICIYLAHTMLISLFMLYVSPILYHDFFLSLHVAMI
jgi:hypothetical protein